ncbi:LD-carboxypeptidase [Sedimentibacter sp. zth1]|uniref:S66 family peptidase n=1 Tax=Sedimentibacter sp. zth1 TaxID=2816908 RepID=UPI001A926201|nr:S66 peptidase family protein [Sedimentibacter sp. zth1]QSX06940.1 LD-carboxypeptidase [Sedimentibacter sp. zth1]
MILAPKLKKGDTIAVFSPSSPATATVKKRYSRGKQFLESQGFNFFEGYLTGKQDFYRSGSILERATELNELIYNPNVKCIMAAIGGMNSNSILPYVDYQALKENPKIIIGYSDVTALLLAIYAKTDLVTYYGPAVVASFGEFPPFVNETFQYFSNVTMGKSHVPYIMPTPECWTDEFLDWKTQDRGKTPNKNTLITLNEGKAKGRIIGGNLNTMQGIWNTEYMPEIKCGDILFIEDSLKDIATIERSFSLLKLSGVFDKIGGLILGKHELFDDLKTNRKPYDVLKEVMGNVDFPVLAEFDCCHTHPMLTMPIGCEVELDATNKCVTVLDDFVSI